MEDNNPVFSIITVCYKAQDIITKTVKSVLAQTYSHVEYIVVDGNSPDNTAEVVRSLSPSIRLISEPDKGLYDAMNKGL
ncbi:glycosyltransferase, partial [Porphyromonas loveana]